MQLKQIRIESCLSEVDVPVIQDLMAIPDVLVFLAVLVLQDLTVILDISVLLKDIHFFEFSTLFQTSILLNLLTGNPGNTWISSEEIRDMATLNSQKCCRRSQKYQFPKMKLFFFDNPDVEIWACLAKFKLKSLNLIFPLDWFPCSKALNFQSPQAPTLQSSQAWNLSSTKALKKSSY